MDIMPKLLKLVFLSLPLSAAFYYLMYRLYRYFLGIIPASGEMTQFSDKKIWKNDVLIVLGIFTALTVLFFFQYFSQISHALIGPPQDNLQNYWNFWWGYNVIQGRFPEFAQTNMMLYPQGANMLYHSYSWYNLFLSFVLRHIDGPVFAYNVLILQTFALAGLGAYLLARYLLGSTLLALLAAFIFAFSPAHFAQAESHLNIASIQFIPFFILYYIKAIKGRRKFDIFLAALFLFLNAICSWNYLIFGFYFMALSYIYLAIRRKRIWLFDVISKSLAVAIISIIPISYWLARMVLLGLKSSGPSAVGHNYYVADNLGLITPSSYHLLGNLLPFRLINNSFTGNVWEVTVYLGLVVIIILIIAFRSILRDISKYVLAFIAFAILAMGSTLHIAGYSTPILLPYRVLYFLPFLSNIRCPSRHLFYGYIFLGIMAAIAVYYLHSSKKLGKYRNYIITGLVVLIVVDYYPVPREMTPIELPACYNKILQDKSDYAILDLPYGWVPANTYMMYQTFHEHPIVQGTVSRKIRNTLIDELDYSDLARQKDQLVANNVKYIVIHKSFIKPDHPIDTLRYGELYSKIYSDRDNLVFRVYR